MTILSPETLVDFLDLIAAGHSVNEATVGIGAMPKSKIVYKWMADSEKAADEFEGEAWLVTWRDKEEFFHVHYADAVMAGIEIRANRRTPLREDLEAQLEAIRAKKPKRDPQAGHREVETIPVVYDRVVQAPINLDPAAPKPDRPAYAYRRPPPLDAVNNPHGPPEGGFRVARHVVSRAEARAGTVEITDRGVRKW